MTGTTTWRAGRGGLSLHGPCGSGPSTFWPWESRLVVVGPRGRCLILIGAVGKGLIIVGAVGEEDQPVPTTGDVG